MATRRLQHGDISTPGRSLAVRPTALVVAVSVMVGALIAVLFGARWTPSSDAGAWASAGARDQEPRDRLLGGLLSPDFDDRSCLSRYRAALYRRPSFHHLSPHLVARIRRYESIHRLCGPGTAAYARAVARLRSPQPANASSADSSGCGYLVWSPFSGLGNRMLSATSAFLYALLTDRVLLFHRYGDDMNDLFCEPFPGSTWILPEEDFPIRGIERFDVRTRESLGDMISRGEGPAAGQPPAPWVYVHLRYDYKANKHNRFFFCDDEQSALRRVPWLVLRSDNYFVPGLFLIPRFERELARMFPHRDAVFHHLGRYLLHPSNTVWGMATRYRSSYLAGAEELVGIQVRTFSWAPISTDELYGQIVSCVHGENILPGVPADNATVLPSSGQAARRKAVLVVSLHGEYYEMIRSLYYERGAAGGEAVSVFQPTHLEEQSSGERRHNQKALAEMVLLSFSDVLVTTAVSTFGYVSHGLAGKRPWVLMGPVGGKAPNPSCWLAATVEPCFHTPPQYDCRARADGDSGRMVRHVRHCEDFPEGVQLAE